MALPPENPDAGRRAIVIEDVPAGTGIADLVGAFSPFGPIQFVSVGPPAVIGFENESSAAHALLVTSMKSVSLLGVFRQNMAALSKSPVTKAAATASPSEPAAPETKISQIETAAAAPTEAAAPETKTSQDKAASSAPPAVIVDRETIESIRDSIAALEENAFVNQEMVIVDRETIESIRDSIAALEENAFVNQEMGNAIAALERHVGTMKQLLIEQCDDQEYEEEEDVTDDLDHDKAWSDGYNLGFWGNSNHYEAWLAGYQAGVKDSQWKEGDSPIHGNPMLAN